MFVLSTPKTVFKYFVCGSIFLLLSVSVHATSIRGLSNPYGLLHCEVSKRSLARLGGDRSLSLYAYLNFHSMPKTNENASMVNHSSLTNTLVHETYQSLHEHLKQEVENLNRENSFYRYVLWYLIAREIPEGDTSFLEDLDDVINDFSITKKDNYTDLLEDLKKSYYRLCCPNKRYQSKKGNIIKVDFRKKIQL